MLYDDVSCGGWVYECEHTVEYVDGGSEDWSNVGVWVLRGFVFRILCKLFLGIVFVLWFCIVRGRDMYDVLRFIWWVLGA